MTKPANSDVAYEIEYAVFDSLGFNPDSISPTEEMARQFTAVHPSVGDHEIRSRRVTEWVTV